MSEYVPRLVDSILRRKLDSFGAVLIVGPKWSGKTTTAEQVAMSSIYLQDPDKAATYSEIAKLKPSNLLIGEKPRLIDEWQMEVNLWDAVRFSVDRSDDSGLYILTGSVTPPKNKKRHTGTGRITRLEMRNMSLFEFGDSSGDVSLADLFSGSSEIGGHSNLDYTRTAEVLVRGGWPKAIGKELGTALDIVEGYCEGILDADIDLPDGRRRDKEKMRRILKSLARNTGMSAPNTTISGDVGPSSEGGMSINTVSDYISALREIYVVEDLPAWSPKLRSKSAIRTSDVRHMSDPAIAAYFMGAGPKDLEMDPRTFGLLFESLVVRDLRVYSQKIGGRVYHYRDSDDLEVDAVIHLHDGRWGAVEVKLGMSGVDDGARNLLRLARKVDSDAMNHPSFLAVVTATEYAYTREDGVHVIPLGCLRD